MGFLPGQELLDDHTVTARAYQNVLHGKSMFDLELWPVSGKRGKQEAIKTAKGKVSDFSVIGELGQVAETVGSLMRVQSTIHLHGIRFPF